MRLKAISLSWFRGAASEVALECDGKSVAVYGSNGSGKSSFVDALEYSINGKVAHLSHEYSGKRQERGLQNTHRPSTDLTRLKIHFQDDTARSIQITKDGIATSTGTEEPSLALWDCKRTILRQDEVAQFISDTKGAKYSALLPLLGLRDLETSAENLRQLSKTIADAGELQSLKALLRQGETIHKTVFPGQSGSAITRVIDDLHNKYVGDAAPDTLYPAKTEEVVKAIDKKVSELTTELRRHVVLCDVASLDIAGLVSKLRHAESQYASLLEPLLAERIAVLEHAARYASAVPGNATTSCPACGRDLTRSELIGHVTAERARLSNAIEARTDRDACVGLLSDAIVAINSALGKPDLDAWLVSDPKRALGKVSSGNIDVSAFRKEYSAETLGVVEEHLLPICAEAKLAAGVVPPDASQLSVDRRTAEAACLVLDSLDRSKTFARIEALVNFTEGLEQAIRDQIKERATQVIADISQDVQAMWATLHPGRLIAEVALYMPVDADKAVDIRLVFHGVPQESPRLTLSEGYRNSLGLCIFLALAKREGATDRPLVLDDVIVSLDRHHRGLLVDVLKMEFSHRQVVVLTHDREWFTELRHLLSGPDWVFRVLLPFESPETGIRWSHRTTSFEDARAIMQSRPDSAGNDARKIMDIELALIAERLQVRFPFLRGEKNDMRMAHDLLSRIASDARKCFQSKEGDSYTPFLPAIEAFEAAARVLSAWANRASHTFSVELAEAEKLLDACEAALQVFKCQGCDKPVWFAEASGAELVQCSCGNLRWRYGKAG